MTLLKQSTAATIKLGPFVDSTDGITPETALTISQADIRLSKNGGAFAQTNNVAGATHDENGWYGVPLDTTDTATLGRLQVAVYESGALPCFTEFMVVPANVYDSLIAGSDVLDISMIQILGTAVSAPATAGILDTNVKNIANAVVNTATAQIGANVVTQANIDFGALQKTSLNAATPASVQNIPATGSGFTALGDARIANLDATISSRLAPAGTLATVTTLTGHTPQTGDSFARLGAPAGASIAADLVVIDNFVDDLETRLSAIRAGYLDNLSAGAAALEGTLTQMKQKVAGTYDRETDSLEALRDRGDAAWITATGFATAIVCTEARLAELDAANLITDVANVKADTAAILIDTAVIGAAGAGLTAIPQAAVLIDTTIAVVTDQTHFTLTAGSDIDSAYLDQTIVLYDASNNNYPSVRVISAYVGATKTVTLDSTPGFTILAGDGVKVFTTAPGTTAPTVGQVADGVWDELIAGHAVAGSTADTLSKNGKKADRNFAWLLG